MGLYKKVAAPSGATLRYHRVASVTHVTNAQTVVEVAGYASLAARAEELAARESGEACDVLVETSYLAAPYDDSMGVEGAYAWLKTLPEYEGASDVGDDGSDVDPTDADELVADLVASGVTAEELRAAIDALSAAGQPRAGGAPDATTQPVAPGRGATA